MTTEENINYISSHLSAYVLWGQLAEECCELAQAALKMQRCSSIINPPRKTPEECLNDLIEEHADLVLCFKALHWNDKEQRSAVIDAKAERWANLIRERSGDSLWTR